MGACLVYLSRRPTRNVNQIPSPSPPSKGEERMRRWIVQGLLPALGAGLLLLAVIVGGQWARQGLHGQERYELSFAAVECAPPPGLTREEFLTEVQYLSGLPDRLDVLAADTPPR